MSGGFFHILSRKAGEVDCAKAQDGEGHQVRKEGHPTVIPAKARIQLSQNNKMHCHRNSTLTHPPTQIDNKNTSLRYLRLQCAVKYCCRVCSARLTVVSAYRVNRRLLSLLNRLHQIVFSEI